jgi:two-component system, LuxR family, sensor kinase FixL
MSYVTVLWSVVASCALLLALMQGYVWLMDRRARASLAFAVLGLSVVWVVIAELGFMRATSAQEMIELHRRIHIPVLPLVIGIVAFIRLYFGAGRLWLMWIIIAIRCLVLAITFNVAGTFNYDSIDSIERIPFLGEQVSVVGDSTVGRWQWIGLISTVLVLAYLVDAAITLWRRGSPEDRRRAVVIGSAVFVSTALAVINNQLTTWDIVRLPPLISLPFLILFGAMALEISRDTLRSARLAHELRGSEERLEFAADAAGIGLWTWEAKQDRLWATQTARAMCGLSPGDALNLAIVRSRIHEGDLPRIDELLRQAAVSGAEWEVQFRLRLGDVATRWLLARGRSEADESGKVSIIRGVLRDITEQNRARHEIDELRRELAHASRVHALGTLSSSIAHELGQPLAAIMQNAEAAEIMLRAPTPDLPELREILRDIQRDDMRAGDIISRLRSLLKRREMDFATIPVDTLVQDAGTLLRTDAISRQVVLECSCDAGVPAVRGDRVHLTQVLINIVINAMDAMAGMPAERRAVKVHARVTTAGWVEISVEDRGPGIPEDLLKRIFEPFFTTKTTGTGLGLSVSRTIVEAHNGRLMVDRNTHGGATFRLMLPVAASGTQNS